MKIPKCAPFWFKQIARRLVDRGRENLNQKNVFWVDSWQMSLYWMQTQTYSVLFYNRDGTVDDAMQMQVLDAFASESKRPLISIAGETGQSAFCFFGGAPERVQLATLSFHEAQSNLIQSTLPSSFKRS